MQKLVVESGPQAGAEFPLNRLTTRLGRGAGSDVLLQTTQASRQHAEINRQGDQVLIQDLGSTNGTFVNGERVTSPRTLRPGDRVQIGDVVLAYQLGPVSPAAASAWSADPWDEAAGDPWDQAAVAHDGSMPVARKGLRVMAIAGLAAVVLLAGGIAAALFLGRDAAPGFQEGGITVAPTSAIVVIPTGTVELAAVQATVESLVDVTAVNATANALVEQTQEPVEPSPTKPPATGIVELPTALVVATTQPVPAAIPVLPTSLPVAFADLEQLPASVTQFLGNVPADQLPQALVDQMSSLSPDQLRNLVGSLFSGVDPGQLPQVIAASFPDLPQAQVQALLQQVFPGQSFSLPTIGGPVGGRLALGIRRGDEDLRDLYLVDGLAVGGATPARLVEYGQEPAFSPDGRWLVYLSWAPDRLGLRLVRTDGTGDSALTPAKSDSYPSFSPDGLRIVLYNTDQRSIVTLNRDGSGRREIAKGEYPAWSSTGDQVVYRGCLGGGRCGLIVANADGSAPVQITTHANDAAPRWSPNGGQIAFHSDRDGNWEVYVINADGSWLRRITTEPATDVMPVWSPDGLRIAFRSDRGGAGAVWATSGIGGLATKQFDAPLSPNWSFDRMDWGR